jgi:ATP-dependent Clp protease adaptor protein ClpS
MSKEFENDDGDLALEKEKTELKKPSLYKVIMFNDDFTPFEFVELLLMSCFNKSESVAAQLTKEIHEKGSAVVGVYPKDLATTKAYIAEKHAEQNEFPLKCAVEPE